jgi:hypothetical protein
MRTSSRQTILSSAFLFLILSACKPEVTPTEPTAKPSAAPVTLLRLENGDRACYVVFQTANNTEESMEGSFELCAGGQNDATPLIGKKITYTTKKANVLAAECEGNMDCGKSDEVDLIETITAVE